MAGKYFGGGKIERDLLGIYGDFFLFHKLLNQVSGLRPICGEANSINLDFTAFFFEAIIFQTFIQTRLGMAYGILIRIRENDSQLKLPQETKDVTLPEFFSRKMD